MKDLNVNIENQKIKIEDKSQFGTSNKQNDEVVYHNELHLILRFIRNQEHNTIEI